MGPSYIFSALFNTIFIIPANVKEAITPVFSLCPTLVSGVVIVVAFYDKFSL